MVPRLGSSAGSRDEVHAFSSSQLREDERRALSPGCSHTWVGCSEPGHCCCLVICWVPAVPPALLLALASGIPKWFLAFSFVFCSSPLNFLGPFPSLLDYCKRKWYDQTGVVCILNSCHMHEGKKLSPRARRWGRKMASMGECLTLSQVKKTSGQTLNWESHGTSI